MQPEGSDEWDLQVLEVGFGPGSLSLRSRDILIFMLYTCAAFNLCSFFFFPTPGGSIALHRP